MSLLLSGNKSPYKRYPDTQDYRCPPAWDWWFHLCDLAPALRRIHNKRPMFDRPPPRPMTDYAFCQFAASFADPLHRAAMEKLFANLLQSEIKRIVREELTRRNP